MTNKRYWLAIIAFLGVVGVAGFFARSMSVAGGSASEAVSSSMSLSVDISKRRLSVIENGEVTATYPVAVGRPSYPTPKGSFVIRHIVWNPRWVPPDSPWAKKKKPKGPGEPGNPMGKVKMFFQEPDYYIHGTHEVDSLGQAESHGCIRMRNGDVVALAQRVMRAGGKPVEPGWVHRVINKLRSTKEVRLSTGVRLTVHS